MADEKITKYLPAKMIQQQVAPVATRKLRAWARQGLIRVAKLGGSKQSPALFRTEDVVAVLEAYAAGRRPSRRRRP
jgi:hypothetical protein